jgi:ABC-type phosphate/phosphonate transport system substrate-binding protein
LCWQERYVQATKSILKVLIRKANPVLEKELGVPIVVVDYADIQAVVKILEENNVDTVISAINMLSAPSGEQPREIEIIRAADASKTTRRMMSSHWGGPHPPK